MKTTFLSYYNSEKERFRANITLFKNLLPTNRSREVALLSSNWYHGFIDWLQSDLLPPPGKLQQKILYNGQSVKSDLKFHVDYEVVEKEGWDLINSTFGPAPKIIRPYVRHPQSKVPCVLLNFLQLKIKINDKIIKKVCALDWKLSDIKPQLCQALNYSTYNYVFSPFTAPHSIDNLTIEEIAQQKYDFIYLLKNEHSTQSTVSSQSTLSNSILSSYVQNHINTNSN